MNASKDAPTKPVHSAHTGTGASTCAANTARDANPVFPDAYLDCANPSESKLTRRGVLDAKNYFGIQREATYKELRGLKASPEKDGLYEELRFYADEEADMKRRLEQHFIPQHGPTQFLSPRAFFQSSIFNARSRSVERSPNVELILPTGPDAPTIRYSGPELRQSDGRVFLVLLHMLRDIQVGTKVTLLPEAICVALFGRYNGNTRKQLRTHIQRLQKGLIVADSYSVQLCQEFDYPARGPWGVALHPHIVELFRISPRVWLSMPMRLSITEGLPSWLYAFVQSQTKLIPMRIAKLRELSGSESEERAFVNSMRLALKELTRRDIIEPGWSLLRGQVHWMKKRQAQPEA